MRVFFTSFLIFLLNSSIFSQSVPSYVPQQGLIGWWPFNGNANDESGNGNDGIVIGASLSTDRFGDTNSSYSFYGTQDFIRIPGGSSININTQMTFSGWINKDSINPNSNSNSFTPIHFQYGTPAWGRIWLYDLHTGIRIYTQNSSYGGHPSPQIYNSWCHIAFTIDSTLVTLYLNGDSVSSYNNSIPLNANGSTGNISIGRFYPLYESHGLIDDIGIWNRVLSKTEISGLYQTTNCTVYDTIAVTDTLIINAQLVGINPINSINTMRVWPNPASTHITIDNGDYSLMNGYTLSIENALGQQVFSSPINQQQFYIDLSQWTGNGLYLLIVRDGSGNALEVKKIVLQ